MRWMWLIFLIVWVLVPNAKVAEATAPEAAPIEKITVGIETDYPPYTYLDGSGQPAGYGVELIRAVAREENLILEFRPLPWSAIYHSVQKGQIDAISIIARSEFRAPFFEFTDTHVITNDAIFIRDTPNPKINSEVDLKGKDLVVIEHDFADEFLRAHDITNQLQRVPSTSAGFQLLSEGKTDAFVTAHVSGLRALASQSYRVKLAARPFIQSYSREYAMAVAHGRLDLRDRLNRGLAKVRESGEYLEIYDRWFADEFAQPVIERHQRLVLGLAITILLLVVATGLVVIFRREVGRQTKNLATSERRFRGLVENIPGAVYRCVKGPKWEVEFISDAVEKLVGYPASDFLHSSKRRFPDLIHPDDVGRVWEIAALRASQPGPYEVDFRIWPRTEKRAGSTRAVAPHVDRMAKWSRSMAFSSTSPNKSVWPTC